MKLRKIKLEEDYWLIVIKMKSDIKDSIKIPSGIEIELDGSRITVKGEKCALKRRFGYPKINITKENDALVLFAKNGTKREKTMIKTFKAHIGNMIKGVLNEYEYKLKVCSSHFPISVVVQGDKLIIKNFLGEKTPRKAKIEDGVNVNVQGEIITIKSNDKEKAGQTAANMERATRITKRDRRIFQDGLWIFHKGGKDV